MKKRDGRMCKLCITSLIIAVIITGLTWFYSSPLIGSVNRGFPLAYHYTPVVLNPVATWNFVNLIIDIVIWGIIAFTAIYVIEIRKKAKK